MVVAWGCAGGGNWGPVRRAAHALWRDGNRGRSRTEILRGRTTGRLSPQGCGSLFSYGQCVPVGLSGAIAAAGGYFHSLAAQRRRDGGRYRVRLRFRLRTVHDPAGPLGRQRDRGRRRCSLALVELGDQTITFAPLPNRTFGDPDFTVSASTSSGLPVSFAASGECVLNGTTVLLTDVGQCTIIASQPGNGTTTPRSTSRTPSRSRNARSRLLLRDRGVRLSSRRWSVLACARPWAHSRQALLRRSDSASALKRIGRVLAQNPKPGRRLRKGARVSLVVGRQ